MFLKRSGGIGEVVTSTMRKIIPIGKIHRKGISLRALTELAEPARASALLNNSKVWLEYRSEHLPSMPADCHLTALTLALLARLLTCKQSYETRTRSHVPNLWVLQVPRTGESNS